MNKYTLHIQLNQPASVMHICIVADKLCEQCSDLSHYSLRSAFDADYSVQLDASCYYIR